MRRIVLALLALLIIAVPLNGAFADRAHAASSRVAVIKELKGTVKVKKSGGSKEFTAFAKMSLNEGDVLSVGDNGSAVLQFANGMSEDDRMTVSSNSKLSFSKLSDKKGTTTKVSMWSGKAWVDVKSIASSSDEFTLETPTAVMGVRGTHLFVTIDPLTQLTRLTVAAGVVRTLSKSSGQPSVDVYPSQQIVLAPEGEDPADGLKTTIDLNDLIGQSNPSIIQAFLTSIGEIQEENDRLMQDYRRQMSQLTPEDLERFQDNIESFIGAYVEQALSQSLVTQEQINKLLEEVLQSTGQKIDLTKKTIKSSDEERLIQEEQRKLAEQLKKQAEEKMKKEQQDREIALKDKLKELERQKQLLEQQRKEALLKAQQQAKEAYEKLLQGTEKERFKKDAEARAKEQEASPGPGSSSTSTSTTPPLSQDASLASLKLFKYTDLSIPSAEPSPSSQQIELSPSFAASTLSYLGSVGSEVTYANIKPVVNVTGATVTINEQPLSGQSTWVPLAYGNNTISIKVTAPNGLMKQTYTITIHRQGQVQGDGRLLGISGLHLTTTFDPEIFEYVGEVESPYLMVEPEEGSSVTVKLNGSGISPYDGPVYRPNYIGGVNVLEVIVVTEIGGSTTYTFTVVFPQTFGIRINGEPIVLSEDVYVYEREIESSEYTITADFDSGYEVSVNGVPVSSGIGNNYFASLGVNNVEITVDAGDRPPLVYTLRLYLASKPAGIANWSTVADTEIGQIPLYWIDSSGEGPNRYYAVLPIGAESVTFEASFLEGRMGKIDGGTYTEAPLSYTVDSWDESGYTHFRLITTNDGGESNVPIDFYLLSEDVLFDEHRPSEVTASFWEVEFTNVIHAKFLDGAYYLTLPENAYSTEDGVLDFSATVEDESDSIAWIIDGTELSQATGASVGAAPHGFAKYALIVRDWVGYPHYYPVYVYQGNPTITEGDWNYIYPYENHDGWIILLAYNPVTYEWSTQFALELPGSYSYAIRRGGEDTFLPDEEGVATLEGTVDPENVDPEIPVTQYYELIILDEDGVEIANYELEMNLSFPSV
ncbi:cadherin-like beta sandwich domain-containing protein [Cohnella sp. GCM10027633]|uniref:cadherin-like beta sandwich domain-containing protein n=1 Tax=unclassified Cohnella TaxID=2636738 RepID=UPI00362CDE2D